MKKSNLAAYVPVILFLFISFYFAIIASIQWIDKTKRDRELYVADSIERIENRKWIIDSVIKQDTTYDIYAHNKSFPKLKVKFSSYKNPTFLTNDTIVDLIK